MPGGNTPTPLPLPENFYFINETQPLLKAPINIFHTKAMACSKSGMVIANQNQIGMEP